MSASRSPAEPRAAGLATALALALALVAPAPGGAQTPRPARLQPHPALLSLVPLIEVYDARLASSPEYDVAGIRCAGLVLAQDEWAERTRRLGLRRATPAQQRAVDHALTASEITRRNRGMGISLAYTSTREDVVRVVNLYTARFAAQSQGGRHPWRNDPLMRGDTDYCSHILR